MPTVDKTKVPIASAVGTHQKGFIMEKVNILRVDIRDNEEFDGDTLLHSYYLVDPDMEKLNEVREDVEARFNNEDENGDPSYQTIDDIEAELKKHFTLVDIRKTEIMW